MNNSKHTLSSPPESLWTVTENKDASSILLGEDLVMAWAEDQITGEPRYIGELKANQRGSKCNCKCSSCGLPLTAVNAAKFSFVIRPHFRHPAGAEKKDCLVLAARVAALQLLKNEGMLILPRHRKLVHVTGISGKRYEAWVESPQERVNISNFSFEDKASAILTLDDGRRLKVQLVGRIDANKSQTDANSPSIPKILLIVDDPTIAAMSPSELKIKLQLIVDDGMWCAHWNEDALNEEARNAAYAKAEESFDWITDQSVFSAEMNAEMRWETLLHLKAKEILEREKRIRLPDLHVNIEAESPSGHKLLKSKNIAGHIADLESVVLERRIGSIRPDVFAKTISSGDWLSEEILIEITVTNTISDERIERIRRENIPAIEIDISLMGGVVTKEEFARLVIDEPKGKRWLFHPRMAQEKLVLEKELSAEITAIGNKELKFSKAKSIPASAWGRQYLEAIHAHGNLRSNADEPNFDFKQLSIVVSHIRDIAEILSIRGYPEANDDELFIQRGNILERLLSFKLNTAVGYKLDSAWQVINSVLQEKSPYSIKWWALYLIGIKVWEPTLNEHQAEKVSQWRSEVKRSIDAGEIKYQRDHKYDRLLTLLFPELAKALSWKPATRFIPEPYPFLRGKAYEIWKKNNPEWAKQWEESKPKRQTR
jgi:hypothetical protein